MGSTSSCVSGSATVIAVNPGAAPLLIALTAIAAAAGVFAMVAVWLKWTPARRMLGGLLVPLSLVAVLSLLSIGAFLLPVVALGWVVFALSGSEIRRGGQL